MSGSGCSHRGEVTGWKRPGRDHGCAPAQIVPGSSADVWQDSACARIRRLYAEDAALHDTHCARRAG